MEIRKTNITQEKVRLSAEAEFIKESEKKCNPGHKLQDCVSVGLGAVGTL